MHSWAHLGPTESGTQQAGFVFLARPPAESDASRWTVPELSMHCFLFLTTTVSSCPLGPYNKPLTMLTGISSTSRQPLQGPGPKHLTQINSAPVYPCLWWFKPSHPNKKVQISSYPSGSSRFSGSAHSLPIHTRLYIWLTTGSEICKHPSHDSTLRLVLKPISPQRATEDARQTDFGPWSRLFCQIELHCHSQWPFSMMWCGNETVDKSARACLSKA